MLKNQKLKKHLKIITLALFVVIGFYGKSLLSNESENFTKQNLPLPDSDLSTNSISSNNDQPNDFVPPVTMENDSYSEIKTNANFGAPIFQIRPNWHIDGKLIEQIKDLKTRFENGDNEAGYILAMNLRYCWHAPFDQKSFDARMQSAEDNHEVDFFIRRLEDSYEKCQGVDTTQKQRFYQIMQVTAEQGYVPTQESYSQFNAEFYMTSQDKKSLPRDEYITEQKKFIAEKLNFLSRAAEHGSLKAMAKLANMYNSQNYGEKGWVKTYAYNQVILNFTDDNALYRRYQWLIEKLTKTMTTDEIFQAQELALQLTTKINAHGTLYHIH
ncbi:SEL1-like repeat protein [Cognaticolwellia mytili]|uniref:hypothetical protein n=1 Tax=Cognaticolwellia mytili TaxID=1888913 RepID=UPI000A16DB45|nr:hypothetical protein [Cognaticolwellia mytili]